MTSLNLNCDSCVFLMIDMQERLLPAMGNALGVEYECGRLLTAARELSVPVLATEQYPKGLGHTVKSLSDFLPEKSTVTKNSFSCLREEKFADALKESGRKTVIIMGIESHICVLMTTAELIEAGYSVIIAEEACCSRKVSHHESAMNAARDLGALVLPTESIIYGLMKKAGTAEFKALLPLFK